MQSICTLVLDLGQIFFNPTPSGNCRPFFRTQRAPHGPPPPKHASVYSSCYEACNVASEPARASPPLKSGPPTDLARVPPVRQPQHPHHPWIIHQGVVLAAPGPGHLDRPRQQDQERQPQTSTRAHHQLARVALYDTVTVVGQPLTSPRTIYAWRNLAYRNQINLYARRSINARVKGYTAQPEHTTLRGD